MTDSEFHTVQASRKRKVHVVNVFFSTAYRLRVTCKAAKVSGSLADAGWSGNLAGIEQDADVGFGAILDSFHPGESKRPW